MTSKSGPQVAATVNPAGEPNVRITQPKPDTYTRDAFMRDLRTVAKKKPS